MYARIVHRVNEQCQKLVFSLGYVSVFSLEFTVWLLFFCVPTLAKV